jgi:hypothetical protein
MANAHPIVRLRRAAEESKRLKRKITGKGGGGFPAKIPYDRQVKRLGKVFETAAQQLLDFEKGVEVAADPSAVVPERCLVFELIGPVVEFNVAAQALGLDWLRTDDASGALPDGQEEDDEEDDEEADEAEDEGGLRPKYFYLTMPSFEALKKLLAQWKRFKEDAKPAPAYRQLWKIFDYLYDLRVWSVKDRLDPNVTAYIDAVLEHDEPRDVLIEIDLWYRSERERRDRSMQTLTTMLGTVGGELLDQIDIEEISYQGALVKVPSKVARQLALGEGEIPLLDDIMTIRPQSAYKSDISRDVPKLREPVESDSNPTGKCLAVLLDGYPVDGHRALEGRLKIKTVEVSGADAPVASRFHGTAMASLIVHGDLHEIEKAVSKPVAVIPVLKGTAAEPESTPFGKLPIGVIYRALLAIVEARNKNDPDFGRVIVINHSICDTFHPFVRHLSPWATLLDYFSHEHRLLFIVSAGNIFSSYPVPVFDTIANFQAAAHEVREAALIGAIEQSKGTRGLLTPAESINALTVGAVHGDSAPKMLAAGIDPFPNRTGMTSLVSALGLGTNRSVKPDLIENGGRFLAAPTIGPEGFVHVHGEASFHVGQMVAAPSSTGETDRVHRISGTSNAAALTTRSSHFIADALDEVFAGERVDWTILQTRAVLLKALLAHGCAWGEIGDFLDRHYPPLDKWQRRRQTVTRFLGYGQPNADRVIRGDLNRITLMADDQIKSEQRHNYRLPIPTSMINTRDVRRIIMTLAWTTPVTNRSIDYRGVILQLFDSNRKSAFWEGVKRREIKQPNSTTASKGTLIHAVLEGKKLVTNDQGELIVCVQAAPTRKEFAEVEVPYALAISIEMAQTLKSRLYAEVSAEIRARARSGVRAGQRSGG